jgi:hypothetical protein
MIIDVLRQACRIDIFDLNYFASNEACGYLNCNPQILPRKGYLKRIAAFIVHFLQETKTSLFVRKVPPGAALFFVVSKNQKDSLSGVAAITDRSVTAGDKFDPQFHFPLFWAYLVSVFFLPCLIVRYCQGGDYQKKAFSYLIDTYLLTYGYYVVGAFWLRRARPNCLVVANDHVMQTRIMTLLAQKMGVPTVYIQHASVTEKFPPLIFDFALLEGVDALRKYEKKGATSTQVFLVGMPKADAFAAAVNGKAVVSRVGICCNLFDGEDEVKTLCAQLVQRFPTVKFTLRPHPGDNRRFGFWKQMTANLEMGYSDPLAGVLSIFSALWMQSSRVNPIFTLKRPCSMFIRCIFLILRKRSTGTVSAGMGSSSISPMLTHYARKSPSCWSKSRRSGNAASPIAIPSARSGTGSRVFLRRLSLKASPAAIHFSGRPGNLTGKPGSRFSSPGRG